MCWVCKNCRDVCSFSNIMEPDGLSSLKSQKNTVFSRLNGTTSLCRRKCVSPLGQESCLRDLNFNAVDHSPFCVLHMYSSDRKLLTLRSVDYLEKLGVGFWINTTDLWPSSSCCGFSSKCKNFFVKFYSSTPNMYEFLKFRKLNWVNVLILLSLFWALPVYWLRRWT